MVILNNVANFWSSLSFKGNINKMRKCLLNYLKNEGIKCEIKDGWIIFEFNDSIYEVNFLVGSKCAECVIAFEIYDEALVPDDYKTTVETVKVDMKAITSDIKNGVEVNGAQLVSNLNMQIK